MHPGYKAAVHEYILISDSGIRSKIFDLKLQLRIASHSVLRVVLTFNISNIKKEGGFDSRIFVGIMWYTQFFPLSAPPKSLV